MHLYLYSVVNVLASKNSYYVFNKVGLTQVQQYMLYLYPPLLQPRGVYVCKHVRSRSSTLFTL